MKKRTEDMDADEVENSLRAFLGSNGIITSALITNEDVMDIASILFDVPHLHNGTGMRDMREAIARLSNSERRRRVFANLSRIDPEFVSTVGHNDARLIVSNSISGARLSSKQMKQLIRKAKRR